MNDRGRLKRMTDRSYLFSDMLSGETDYVTDILCDAKTMGNHNFVCNEARNVLEKFSETKAAVAELEHSLVMAGRMADNAVEETPEPEQDSSSAADNDIEKEK